LSISEIVIVVSRDRSARPTARERVVMAHPVVHAEIRSQDPDATRAFFSELFGWTYSDGAYAGYTFVDTGAQGALPTAISPLQGDADQVLFFVGVDDVAEALEQAERLGGRIVQPTQSVPGVTFGVLADPQGHLVGVAASLRPRCAQPASAGGAASTT
jgi:predicted enzyme related to lactoylglutathione lyase